MTTKRKIDLMKYLDEKGFVVEAIKDEDPFDGSTFGYVECKTMKRVTLTLYRKEDAKTSKDIFKKTFENDFLKQKKEDIMQKQKDNFDANTKGWRIKRFEENLYTNPKSDEVEYSLDFNIIPIDIPKFFADK